MKSARAGVLVLCIGNPDRGDDGFGPAVANALDGRLPPDAALATRSGDMLSLIEDWKGFDALVCVDAAAQMTGPGTLHRIDLAERDLPGGLGAVSSHAFGLGEAVALARTLGLAPPAIIVYALEGESFESGATMSANVAAAVAPVAEQILIETARLQETANHA